VLIKTVSPLSFLGAFAKLLQEAIHFVMSVRPSAWNNSLHTGRIFMKTVIRVRVVNVTRKWKVY
jgi:hypothetical protein